MRIKNFADAQAVLIQFAPKPSAFRGLYTLDRMRLLMEKLGNPQNSYRVIHVAGTSGKTSTCYYVAALLQQSRKKVGLTVSPHVDEANERIQINLVPLPEKKFCTQLSKFLDIIEKTGLRPTYFELLVAFAFWQFAEEKVDYAVIEVGLGGLLDGTNVMDRPDKVCVITDIGLDHTSILGSNIAAIASQKAGIIHPHNPVFTYKQSSKVMEVFREVSDGQQAELHEVVFPKPAGLPEDLPPFQKRNWYLAYNVASYIAKRDGLSFPTDEELFETTKTYIPARMEIVKLKGKTIVIDGSHNPQKLGALVKGLQAKFPDQKFAVLIGMLQERSEQVRAALKEISPVTSSVMGTSFYAGQDVPRDPLNPLKIVESSKKVGLKATFFKSPEEAFKELVSGPEKYILVTGSFYLLNHVRPLIFKKK